MTTVNPDSRDRPCAGKRECLADRKDCLTPTEDVGQRRSGSRSPTRCHSSGNCGWPPDPVVSRSLSLCGDVESNPGPKMSEILALALGEARAIEDAFQDEVNNAVDAGHAPDLARAQIRATNAEAQIITNLARCWQNIQERRADHLREVMGVMLAGPEARPASPPQEPAGDPWCPEFPTHDRLQSWTHLSAGEILVAQERADFWPWLEQLELVRQLRQDLDYQVETLSCFLESMPNCERRNQLQAVLKRLKTCRGDARNLAGSDEAMFKKCVGANNPAKCKWLSPSFGGEEPLNIGSWGLPRPRRRWRREDYIRRLIMVWDGSAHRWQYRGRPGTDSDFARVTKSYDVVRVVRRDVPGGNAVAVVYLSPCILNIGALKPRRRNLIANHLWADYYRDQRPADTFQPQEPHSLVIDEKMMQRVLREPGVDQACVKLSLLSLSMRSEGRDFCLSLPNKPVADMSELRAICSAWSAVEARDLNVYVAWVNGGGPASLHLRYQFTTGKPRTWTSPVIASLIILNTQGPDGQPRSHCCPSSGAVKDTDRCLANHYGLRGPDYCVPPEVVLVSAKEHGRSAFMTSLLGKKDVAAEQALRSKILMLHEMQQENEDAVAAAYEEVEVPSVPERVETPKRASGRKWRVAEKVREAVEALGLVVSDGAPAPAPPRPSPRPQPVVVHDPRGHVRGLEMLYRCKTDSQLLRSLCILAVENPPDCGGVVVLPKSEPVTEGRAVSPDPPSPPGKAKGRYVHPPTPDCAGDGDLAELLEAFERSPSPEPPNPEATSAPRATLSELEAEVLRPPVVTLETLKKVVPAVHVAQSQPTKGGSDVVVPVPAPLPSLADLPRHPSDQPKYKKLCEACGNDFVITVGVDALNRKRGWDPASKCMYCRNGVNRAKVCDAVDPTPPLQYPRRKFEVDPRINDSGEWEAVGEEDPKRCRRERPPHPDKFGDPPCRPRSADGPGLSFTDSGVSRGSDSPTGSSPGNSDSEPEPDPSIVLPPVMVHAGIQSLPSTEAVGVQTAGSQQSLPTYTWPPTRTIIYEGEVNQLSYPCNWRAGWWEVPTEGVRVADRAPTGWMRREYLDRHRWDGGPWSHEPRTSGYTLKDALSRMAVNPSICLATETNLKRWGDNTLYIEPRVQQGYRFIRKGVFADNACHAVQAFRVDSVISRGREEWSAMPIDMVMPDGGKLRLLQLVRLDVTLGLGPLCSSLFPSWTWGKASVKCYSPHALKTIDTKQLNAAKWLGTAKICANNPVLLGFVNLHRAAGDLSDPDDKLDYYRMLACTYQMPVNISGLQDKDHCFRRLRCSEEQIVGQVSSVSHVPHHQH